MQLLRLYIENFFCHEISYLNLEQISSAIIIGKIENNDAFSNGVGKTTIFKAIEYCLFNEADITLDKIIRDDSQSCQISIDFISAGKEYRVIRKRTRKGSTDLTLLEKIDPNTPDEKIHEYFSDGIFKMNWQPGVWNDLSCRRSADTEKELEKLIKINFKSFRNTIHFLQNDFSGLTTATPEKRKLLFKEALNLLVYSKLEKIAKDKSNIILKDIERQKMMLESFGDLDEEKHKLTKQLLDLQKSLNDETSKLKSYNLAFQDANEIVSSLKNNYENSAVKYNDLINQIKNVQSDIDKASESKKSYTAKIEKIDSELEKIQKDIVSLTNKISDNQYDTEYQNKLTQQISNLKEEVVKHNVAIKQNMERYEELKLPIPDKNYCKHCRQTVTAEHAHLFKQQIINDIETCKNNIETSKQKISVLNTKINKLQLDLAKDQRAQACASACVSDIEMIKKETSSKEGLKTAYDTIIKSSIADIDDKKIKLSELKDNLKLYDNLAIEKIKLELLEKQNILEQIKTDISQANKIISHHNANIAIVSNNLENNAKSVIKKQKIISNILELENKWKIYPDILQAFSSTGIPSLIIQNVLDNLQTKSNEFLSQLKPGLQLSFMIEKTKSDGSESDTLDITYDVNGKSRTYEQLSGAMKLAVTFSLKLGLSFLLQDIMGTNIKLLLLDEIDQSLDKAGADAFVDIVKFFQKDFTILIITHNDRLRYRFPAVVMVEQDRNMISRARVVNN